MATLTTEQKLRFKRNGFLVLRDVLDDSDVREGREHLYEIISEDADDPASLAERDGDHDEILHRNSESDTASRFTNVAPFERLFRQVYDYAEELTGPEVLAAPDERPAEYCLHGGHLMASREDGEPAIDHDGAIGPILQYPSNITDETRETYDYAQGRHVDGGTGPYATEGDDVEYLPFTIACAMYFDEVEPRGGGFTVWPGSHRKTERYFAEHPRRDYQENPGVLEEMEPGPGFEITGGPGTLVLWHHNIMHGAAPNHSERLRMAGFQRIAATDIGEIGESALGDIWKMYPGIRDLEPAFHDDY
ncbi:MAG: phytanoyl-CoA dioxygenase family protein [Halobacteriaceae archaeon]